MPARKLKARNQEGGTETSSSAPPLDTTNSLRLFGETTELLVYLLFLLMEQEQVTNYTKQVGAETTPTQHTRLSCRALGKGALSAIGSSTVVAFACDAAMNTFSRFIFIFNYLFTCVFMSGYAPECKQRAGGNRSPGVGVTGYTGGCEQTDVGSGN